jgi:hypothetical protein
MSQELEGDTIEETSEKLAQKAQDFARAKGVKRRKREGVNRGMYKSERQGYNLAQSQRSQNVSPETQRGPQTGGGGRDFGFKRNTSNPIKSKTYAGSGNKAKRRMDAMKSEAYVVNQADKTSNTPAYQGYKEGKKNKLTGEPLYKKGNMKENLVTISNINVKPSFYNDEKNAIKDILKKNFNLGEEGYDVARDMGKVRPSKDKKDGTSYPPSEEMKKTQKVNKGPSALERVKAKYGKSVMDLGKKKCQHYQRNNKSFLE